MKKNRFVLIVLAILATPFIYVGLIITLLVFFPSYYTLPNKFEELTQNPLVREHVGNLWNWETGLPISRETDVERTEVFWLYGDAANAILFVTSTEDIDTDEKTIQYAVMRTLTGKEIGFTP